MIKKYFFAIMTAGLLMTSINIHVHAQQGVCPMRAFGQQKIARAVVGAWCSVQAVESAMCIVKQIGNIRFSGNMRYMNHDGSLREINPLNQVILRCVYAMLYPAFEAGLYAAIAYLCLRECEKDSVTQQQPEQAIDAVDQVPSV